MIKNIILIFGIVVGMMATLEAKISEKQKKDLIQAATRVRNSAYAPYSKYYVGSAVLTKEGKIFPGCNVENASYGLTNCAERSAIFSAVSQGENAFVAIAVVTEDGQGSPCGGCRQVINEFNPEMVVLIANAKGEKTQEMTLGDLLPNAFGPKNLN